MVVRLEDAETTTTLLRVLSGGGVAIMPCDTIYGIVGVAPLAEERIAGIKGRAAGKPLLRLIGAESWLPRYTESPMPPSLARFWPGPLTIVFPARAGGTIALRVPEDSWLRRLLEALDRPLASTSVNREGEPPLGEIARIVEGFESEVDVVVAGGDRTGSAPSTVLDVATSPWRVLRQGAVRIPEELLRAT